MRLAPLIAVTSALLVTSGCDADDGAAERADDAEEEVERLLDQRADFAQRVCQDLQTASCDRRVRCSGDADVQSCIRDRWAGLNCSRAQRAYTTAGRCMGDLGRSCGEDPRSCRDVLVCFDLTRGVQDILPCGEALTLETP